MFQYYIFFDLNGNILTSGNIKYAYDQNCKNKITSIHFLPITYENTTSLYIKSYLNLSFNYEGNRLMTVTNSITNVTTSFTYDENGLRRTKTNSDGTTTNYYYSGNRLVTEINTNYRNDFLYDERGLLIGFILNKSIIYFYVRDIFQNIVGVINNSGTLVVSYEYDAYGKLLSTTGSAASTVGIYNPFRYKGYYYNVETQLFYCNSRYYSPDLCRWISPDSIEYLDPESINGLNLYAYCGNDPVNHIDPTGHAWYHWAIGAAIIVACAALTVVTAGGFAAAGTAFASVVSATMAPTALSAVFAGATIGAAAIGTAGMVIGGMSGEDGWSWKNASQGFMAGSIAGAAIGGAWGGAHYALQSAGKMAIRTNINNLVNNPLDEFVTVGPKDGGISGYVRSISQTGDYGQIFASKLPNGMYQIANGHHRVAALRQLGYRYVNFFLVQ